MDIILIRHGQTVDNANRIFSRVDSPLTDLGKRQMNETRDRLKGYKFDNVYCSPYIRARQSMQELSLDGQIDERVHEIKLGILEGRTFEEMEKLHKEKLDAWTKDPLNFSITGAETIIDVMKRVKNFFEEKIKEDKDILVVSHAAFIQTALSWALDDAKYYGRFSIKNAGINVLRVIDETKIIHVVNG